MRKQIVTKEIEIDMGHRVPYHKSKCRNLHGHRYKIQCDAYGIVDETEEASSQGMVIDFSDLKQIMMETFDHKYDHGFVLYENDVFFPMFSKMINLEPTHSQKIIFVDFIPTAENLSKHWFEEIEPKLLEKNIQLKKLTVWETPTSTAVYEVEING